MSNKSIPRNYHALAAKMRPKQIFHHRCSAKGGNKNEEREWIEEYYESELWDAEGQN